MVTKISTKSLIIQFSTFIFLTTLGLVGCSKNDHSKDLSSIDLTLKIERFEQQLFSCKSVDDIIQLSEKNPRIYKIYTEYIVASNLYKPNATQSDIAVELYKFISHSDMDSLYLLTQKKYPDLSSLEDQLTEAGKYILYYFPEDTIDKITTFISLCNYGIIYNDLDNELLIGLDMYMGGDFEVYPLLNPENFPTYRVKKFEPYRIASNSIQTYIDQKIPQYQSNNFIDQAIYEGKKLYLADVLLPAYDDSLKINYLNGQIEWCQEHERNIWSYLVEKEELYNTDKNKIQKRYFTDGPFTAPFGNESSPRAGAWIGWQIVRLYMEKNPEISIHQLISDTNHQGIFRKSGYRPQ